MTSTTNWQERHLITHAIQISQQPWCLGPESQCCEQGEASLVPAQGLGVGHVSIATASRRLAAHLPHRPPHGPGAPGVAAVCGGLWTDSCCAIRDHCCVGDVCSSSSGPGPYCWYRGWRRAYNLGNCSPERFLHICTIVASDHWSVKLEFDFLLDARIAQACGEHLRVRNQCGCEACESATRAAPSLLLALPLHRPHRHTSRSILVPRN